MTKAEQQTIRRLLLDCRPIAQDYELGYKYRAALTVWEASCKGIADTLKDRYSRFNRRAFLDYLEIR